MGTPDAILATYEERASAYARRRAQARRFIERGWLDRLIGAAEATAEATAGTEPRTPLRVLDLGCGPGVPIAAYLLARGCRLTGVDGARAMIDLFAKNLPQATAHHADMRGLDLGATFDAILAWDSFFHLSPADQAGMFPVFARHAAPGARLLFTSGPAEGTAIGAVEGAPVYHSSQTPETYRAWLAQAGFRVLAFVPEDPECGGHCVWLAERSDGA